MLMQFRKASVLGTSVLLALTLQVAIVLRIGGQVGGGVTASSRQQLDVVGDWQGTLEFPGASNRLSAKYRLVLRITRMPDGNLAALNYSIDQGPTPMHTAAVSLQGSTFRFSIPSMNGSYEGQVTEDGASIKGMWTQGAPLPLNFVRATKEAAWEIPTPPPPAHPMASDADPSFAVATLKPTDPSTPKGQTKIIRVMGRRYITQNTSLADLIEVSYGVHARQIVAAPPWVFEDKFDLVGVPDGEGQPSLGQWLTMVQKLLADRFKLAFHHGSKELQVYVLSVGREGVKGLVKSDSTNTYPSGLEFVPSAAGLTLPAQNATLAQFCQMMQQVVLDRPVVDRTGLSGRFDFQLAFLPNESQFDGHPPVIASQVTGEAAPDLFGALRTQLGLKLETAKVPTSVLIVEHAERPTGN